MSNQSGVTVGPAQLPGLLTLPQNPRGLVIFAHGSGSSRLSPRNAYAAKFLQNHGFATLLFDLLTEGESRDRRNVFDVPLLAERVTQAVDWTRTQSSLAPLSVGLFGASTGGGAAIAAAAQRPNDVKAVVSRGGRPDLAGAALEIINAPTLIIVGGEDGPVIGLNETAQAKMRCETALKIIPGASHLFEEPGTLAEALKAAAAWFVEHLAGGARGSTPVR